MFELNIYSHNDDAHECKSFDVLIKFIFLFSPAEPCVIWCPSNLLEFVQTGKKSQISISYQKCV